MNEFLDILVRHYWSANDMRRMKRELGIVAFRNKNWKKEACLVFVCEHMKACEALFNKEADK